MSDEELRRLRAEIDSYAVVRLRARVVVDVSNGTTAAFLETLEGAETNDAELTALADRLRQPVSFDDARLGKFTLDRRIDVFSADVDWNGARASLSLSADTVEAAGAAIPTAHSLWASQREWDLRVRNFAARELLALKNESWLDEGESAVTMSEFAARMQIESISIDVGGSFEFWFADGELFFGHAIRVSGTLAQGPTDAGIAG